LAYGERELSAEGVPVDYFDLGSLPESTVPFKGARFVVEPGSASTPEAHEVRECWMVASGEGELVYDGERHPMEPGDVFLFDPAKTHQARNDRDEDLVVFTVWW
jgi:mannose-6-phosphate isomerase-like protein (cupin superfamily)